MQRWRTAQCVGRREEITFSSNEDNFKAVCSFKIWMPSAQHLVKAHTDRKALHLQVVQVQRSHRCTQEEETKGSAQSHRSEHFLYKACINLKEPHSTKCCFSVPFCFFLTSVCCCFRVFTLVPLIFVPLPPCAFFLNHYICYFY